MKQQNTQQQNLLSNLLKQALISILIATLFAVSNPLKAQPTLMGVTGYGGNGFGTIINYSAGATSLNNVYALTGNPGESPYYSTPIQATDGNLYGTTSQGGANDVGVIFQYDPATNTYSKKIDLSSTLGSNPKGSLLQASDGNLYGLTSQGGANNVGVVFQYDPANNTYIKKIDLNSTIGSYPEGSLIQASDGKLYGMTASGGATGSGVIFQYNPATNIYIKKIDLGSTLGHRPYGSLMQASDGKLYGMTLSGGANYAGVIFQYDPATNIYVKKIDLSSTLGRGPYGSLMQASNGKLYGMTEEGGINDKGVLFQYDPVTNNFTKKIEFSSTVGTKPLGSLMQSSNGKLYSMTRAGGTNSLGVIFEYDPSTNIYTKKINLSITNGINPNGSLMQASNGKLYGMTSESELISGVQNVAVLFQYDPTNNTYTKKIDLSSTLGSHPQGSLIQASDGMLYGITNEGGANYVGVIFQYDPATNTYTKKIDLSSTLGRGPYACLMQANDGKLYGITYFGGATNDGVIFQYDPATNTYTKKIDLSSSSRGGTILANLTQGSDGMLYWIRKNYIYQYDPVTNVNTEMFDIENTNSNGFSCSSLMQASNGKLYGLFAQGGLNNNDDGMIFEYDPVTNVYTEKIYFNSNLGTNPFGSLIEASDGKLYGTTVYGGANDKGVLFQYDPTTNSYNIKIDLNDTIGIGPTSSLMQASDGKLYGMTNGGGTNSLGVIFQYDPATNNYVKKVDLSSTSGNRPVLSSFIEINTNNCPTITAIGATTFCSGGSVTLTSSSGSSYLWSNGATTQSINVTTSGNYFVTVNGIASCSPITVNVIQLQAPAITGSLSICTGGSTNLDAGVYASYLWSTGATTQTINVSAAGNYTITVTSSNGCTASNSVTAAIENFHELWSNNPAVNMAICTATNNQAEPKAVSDGLGGAIITWYDSRNGVDKDIYVQRIDAAGLIKWTLNGTAICTAAGDQTFPKIAADASGGAIITWQDYRGGSQWDVYAQRINAAGSIMWAANGVAICSAINNQLAPNIINDSKGGVILTWSDFRNGATNADIYAQRITDLGVIKWTANGLPVCAAINNQTAPVLVTNGSGGAMIAWSDFRNGNADIYMQRINTNGIIQWAIDGLPICFLPDEINKVALVSDNASGAIVTWEDYRNGTSNSDIYGQRINATGVALWSVNGVSVCNSTGNQFQPAIISDGGKGAIITWRDKRNSSFDIYTQKLDSMGLSKWTNNGLAVCTFIENQSNPALVSDFDGGAYIAWQDFRNGNFDVYAQKVNSAGVNQFTANGLVIGNAANSQQYPFIISDNNGGAIVTWNDSDIFAQNINANGTLGSNYINPTLPVIAATSLTNCGVINTTLSIASGSLNSATNWQWYSGSCGGIPVGTGTSVTVSPAATTTYYVRGESSCVTPGSCSSLTITVIKPKPIGLTSNNITAASAIVKWDTVACAVGYKMQYRKQGVTAWTTLNINANAPTKTISGLLAATTYQWRVKSKFADGTFSVNSATASFTTAAIRSGLETIDSNNELVIYPNPADDKLNLEFPFTKGVSTKITVVNTIGQTVLEQDSKDDANTTQLNIQSLTKGLYVVTVINGDATFTARFIKE